jgi:hypothetical protein
MALYGGNQFYYTESSPWGITGSATILTTSRSVMTMTLTASGVLSAYLNGA